MMVKVLAIKFGKFSSPFHINEAFPHNLCQTYLIWSKSIRIYKYLIKLEIFLIKSGESIFQFPAGMNKNGHYVH